MTMFLAIYVCAFLSPTLMIPVLRSRETFLHPMTMFFPFHIRTLVPTTIVWSSVAFS